MSDVNDLETVDRDPQEEQNKAEWNAYLSRPTAQLVYVVNRLQAELSNRGIAV